MRFALGVLLCACGVESVANDELAQSDDAIVRGTAQPTALTLTARQKLAVGALVIDGWNECTGTLITPTLVATAAHCVEDLRASDVTFAIGGDAAAPLEEKVPSSIARAPGYDPDGDARNDFAVLKFSSPFTAADPIAANCDGLGASLVGKKLQTGGYGETVSDEDNTRRYWAAVTVQRVGSYDVTTNGFGSGGCYGDSGGPLLALVGGAVRLVGTLSWGETCGNEDHYTRVDSVCTVIPVGATVVVEGVSFTPAQATATLALANTASVSVLDVDVGLDSRAAKAIVAARPLASLDALAAVTWVGSTALTRLRDH